MTLKQMLKKNMKVILSVFSADGRQKTLSTFSNAMVDYYPPLNAHDITLE